LKSRRIAGIVYAATTAIVVAFQIALAFGVPWGSFAMGGAFPGQLPPALRVSAIIQAAILLAFAGIVLARSGLALRRWARASRWFVWVVVSFSAVSLVLNLITPSAGERIIWAPVALTLLVSGVLVATAPTVPNTAA